MIKKNNIQGEVQTFNNFEIYACLTEDSNVIRFEDETSIERMAYMSTGDQIIGKAIPDDVFIETIDETNHFITVTQKMDITVDETIKVLCKVQFYPKDNKKDFYKYRIEDAKNKQARHENVFENFVNNGKTDEISEFRFLPALDISNYRDNLLTNIQNQKSPRKKFNEMCKYLYKKSNIKIAQPSTLNCEGDLLMDVNAYTVFNENGEKYIMSQKILDYFGEYLDEMSRASDNTLVGVSINGFTFSGNRKNNDKNIESVFRTTKQWGSAIPYYIKIGTGKLDDSLFNTVEEESSEESMKTFYNDKSESYYDDQYYSSKRDSVTNEENVITDIDKPLFKSQLSEYEVLNDIKFKSSQKDYTALQFAVMRRMFENFHTHADNVSVLNKDRKLDIFSFNSDAVLSKVCKYLGILPSEDLETLQKPANTDFLYYYAYEDGLAYAFYDGNEWVKRTCKFFTNDTPIKIRYSKNNSHLYAQFRNDMTCSILLGDETYNVKYVKNNEYYSYVDAEASNLKISLNLGVTDITKGSFNSLVVLKENLKASGYEYSDDGCSVDYSKPVDEISLVEDYIYCDEDNEVLYTYNNDKKLMISQENNRYFKNIINNIVEFETISSFTKDGTVDNYYLKGVNGFKFDIDKMSLKDRILSLEHIKIRNEYHSENEPVLFSNFIHYKPYLRGFIYDGDTLDLSSDDNFNIIFNFGYKFKMNPNSYSQKAKALNELKKVRPYDKENDSYYDGELIYGESEFNGSTILSPIYVESSFTDEQNIIEGFEYYKNLLIMEGKVDLKDPTTIMFESKKSLDALQNIDNGDEVLQTVFLDSPSSKNYTYYEDSTIKDIKFLDHKDRVFMVGTKNSIFFFNCADIDSLSVSKDKAAVIKLDDELTSIVYEKETKKWIYTLENDGKYAGCRSVKVSYSEGTTPYVEEPIEETNNYDGIDFNEYQFVKPLTSDDKDVINLTDTDQLLFGENEAILARDFAFRKIDENCYVQNVANVKDSDFAFNSKTTTKQIGDIMEDDFVEIEFDAMPTSRESLFLGGSDVVGTYIYDQLVGKWRYSSISVYNSLVKNITKDTHVHLILVDEEIIPSLYLQENGKAITKNIRSIFDNTDGTESESKNLAQFLWLLPRPDLNKNENYVVCVRSGPYVNMSTSYRSNLALKNVSVKSLKVIKEGKLYTQNADEKPEPLYKNGFYTVYREKPMKMAYNYEGYIAVLNGDALFIKSPTMKWKKDEHGNYGYTNESTDFFWKRARIPSQKDLSYMLFNNMSIKEAYQLVCDQKQIFEDFLEKTQNKDETQKTLYAWLKSNSVITPDQALYNIEEKYENKLVINGIKFLMSEKGLYANIDTNAKEEYVIPQNISIQGGVTTQAYIREQTYFNYLRDYYEIILGCNRLSDIIENGVKSFELTQTDLVIVTKSNDVLSLPLQYTYSRDDIENYNNWNVKSLAPEMEFPSYKKVDDTIFSRYGYSKDNENVVSDYYNQMANVTDKMYEITSVYVDKNIQICGGYFAYSQEALNFYSKMLDSEEYSIFNEHEATTYRRPFISYSTDSGRTFTRIDMQSYDQFAFTAEDSVISSIYRIGNKIRMTVTGSSGDVYANDFVITVNGDNYELTNTLKFEKFATKSNGGNGNYENANELRIPNSFVNSGSINNSTQFVNCSDVFFLAVAPASAIVGKVISKDASSIVVSPNVKDKVVASTENEEVRVLIAVYTAKSIKEPWLLLDFKEEYFTDHNSLKVDFIKLEESSNNANLLYSKNETLPPGEYDTFCVLPFLNDTNKTIYSYNEETGKPETLVNSSGDSIYLFDKNTSMFMLCRNPLNIEQNAFSMYSMIKDKITSLSLVEAYALNEDYTFEGNDYNMNAFFNNHQPSLKNAVFTDSNPSFRALVVAKNDEFSALFNSFKKATTNIDVNLMYKWPWTDEEFINLTQNGLDKEINNGAPGFYSKLKELYNDGITITKEWIEKTFKPVDVTLSNGSHFRAIKEIATNTVLTEELISDITLSMTYETFYDSLKYYNQNFSIENDDYVGALCDYEDNSISSIYIGEKGYGSTIDIEKWDEIQPHENDPESFNSFLLKNKLNRFIHICDKYGTDLTLKNGRFEMSNEIGTINYDDLFVEKKIVKIISQDFNEVLSYKNIYKVQDSDINVFSPQKIVSLKGTKAKNIMSIFRVYYSDVDVSLNGRISVELETKLYFDKKLTERAKLNVFYEDGIIYFEKNNKDIYTNGNILKFIVKDNVNGKTCIKAFELINSSTAKVSSLDIGVFAIDENLQEYKILADVDISSCEAYDVNIIISNIENKLITLNVVGKIENNTIKVYVDKKNGKNSDYADSYEFDLDIHNLNPKLYLSTNKLSKTRSETIEAKVFSNELDISDKFNFTVLTTDKENVYKMVANYKNIKLEEEFETFESLASENILKVDDDTFVFTQLTPSINYTVSIPCVIDGLKGRYILSQPKYKNYNDVIKTLERKVFFTDEKLAFDVSTGNEVILKNIGTDKVQIDTDFSSKGQYFVLKSLPVNTYYPDVETLNNEEYYAEVSLSDIGLYGYDRVWINENVFMKPAFTYNDKNYNGSSMSQYSIDKWVNKDGFKVWLCDEFGRFVKPTSINDKVTYEIIGTENGDCSSEIYQSHETRINPCELLYKTSYDMYKNKFYEKGLKTNPFLKKFKILSKKADGNVTYNIYGFTDIIKRNKVSENICNNCYILKLDELDYESSDIVMQILHSFKDNSEDEFEYFYGIKHNNCYYIKNENAVDGASVDIYSNFIIDSTEDVENKDKSTVEEITELGIFSKDNVLLAYMTHPKCQYDTKKNYIAYNLLIEN